MPVMNTKSKLKPEVELQYGGQMFSEIGSSYISAMEPCIPKFGMQIDLDILKFK